MTPMLTPTLLAALGPILALPGAVTETIARLPQMPDFTGTLNEFAGSWGDAIGRASWQAGFLAAGAWAVTRLWGKRLPATVTATLWWLVAAKVLVALVWANPVRLPVLPASVAASGEALAEQITPLTAVLQTGNIGGKGGRRGGTLSAAPSGIKSGSSSGAAAETASATAVVTAQGSNGMATRTMPTPLTMLFCLWTAGVLCHAGLAVRQFQMARALVARAAPLSGANGLAIQSEVDRLTERMGLPKHLLPEVRVSQAIAGPLLVGLSRNPVILLPAHLLPPPNTTALSPEELRLVLAHEMAHLRRFDPLLGLIPALASALLFFHPLVRLASREFDIARESACDAAALDATGDAPGRYGQLLLKLGTLGHIVPLGVVLGRPGRPAPTGTLAAVSEYAPLHRRLVLLQQLLTPGRGRGAAIVPTRRQRIARSLFFVSIGTVGLVPWRIVAGPLPPQGNTLKKAESPVPTATLLSPASPAAQAKSPRETRRPHLFPALSAPTTAPRSSAHHLPDAPAARSLALEPDFITIPSAENAAALTSDDSSVLVGPVLSLRPPLPGEQRRADVDTGAGTNGIIEAAVVVSHAPKRSPIPVMEQSAAATAPIPVSEAALDEQSAREKAAAAATIAMTATSPEPEATLPPTLVWLVPMPEGFALALGLSLNHLEAATHTHSWSGGVGAGAPAPITAEAVPVEAEPSPSFMPVTESLSVDEGVPPPSEVGEIERESQPLLMPPPESFAPITLSSRSATETRRAKERREQVARFTVRRAA